MAKLYFKYGTMKSGKSIDLIKTFYNYELSGRKAIVAKPIIDTRSKTDVKSRLGEGIPSMSLTGQSNQLTNHIKNESFLGNKISAVLIDEAQFLSVEQIMELTMIVDDMDIPVICYGLKTNFRSVLFEGSRTLLEIADKIEEIKTVCQFCDSKAILNLRTIEKDGVRIGAPCNSDEISIGDEEYIQVCRNHYFKFANGQEIIS